MSGLFEDLTPQAGLERLLECVDREISQRARVYPRLVATGKMSEALAKQETELMGLVRSALVDMQRMRASALLAGVMSPFSASEEHQGLGHHPVDGPKPDPEMVARLVADMYAIARRWPA